MVVYGEEGHEYVFCDLGSVVPCLVLVEAYSRAWLLGHWDLFNCDLLTHGLHSLSQKQHLSL